MEPIITKIMEVVKARQLDEASGHDWWHTLRVYNNAIDIARHGQFSDVNLKVVELGALLHDIADHKFGYTDFDRQTIITELLTGSDLLEEEIGHVVYIANNISFKNGENRIELMSVEAKIVQDADRLDAIGAIGIARTFAYGGYAKRNMYHPDAVGEGVPKEDTISHFYEKLLRLKDMMHTDYGKKKACERHQFMELYLERFYDEWAGKL